MDSIDNAEETILYSSDEEKDNQVPFNAELGEYSEEVESACKGDAIGNTLYSKSWLLEFFLTLSNSRNIDTLEKRFMALQCHKQEATGVSEDEEGDPETILSNFDSLVAMSADKTVAEYIIDEQSGCLGMLTAEILPIQINEEHKYFSDIRSHFWRRQELCLVTLSNIVVHNSVLKTMILAINDSNHDKSYDKQNALMQIVHLSFSCVLFGDNFGLQAEFTSVLVGCFQFLRNLIYSLNILITENQSNLLNSNEELTEDDKQTLTTDIEIAYSNPPLCENDSTISKNDSNGNSTPEPIDASKIDIEANNLDNTLQCIAKEILSLFSQPEVVQMTGMMLASSCNQDLLNKMSRVLIVLLELSSDLEYEGLIECYCQLGFLNCVKEALKQTFTVSRDVKTTFVFIDFLGEILNQMKDDGIQGLKSIFLDQHGQQDETFPMELSDILTDITVEMNDLQHCAVITKILSVLWDPSIMSKHSNSFEKVATFIINVDEENGNIENLALDDQVSYLAIMESLSIFLQNYSVTDSNKKELTNIETRISQMIRKEKHQQGQGSQADSGVAT